MIIDGKQIKSTKTSKAIQALINDLGLEEWDLTQSVADLIDPAELMRSFHDCIDREKKPLIERVRLSLLQ